LSKLEVAPREGRRRSVPDDNALVLVHAGETRVGCIADGKDVRRELADDCVLVAMYLFECVQVGDGAVRIDCDEDGAGVGLNRHNRQVLRRPGGPKGQAYVNLLLEEAFAQVVQERRLVQLTELNHVLHTLLARLVHVAHICGLDSDELWVGHK